MYSNSRSGESCPRTLGGGYFDLNGGSAIGTRRARVFSGPAFLPVGLAGGVLRLPPAAVPARRLGSAAGSPMPLAASGFVQ